MTNNIAAVGWKTQFQQMERQILDASKNTEQRHRKTRYPRGDTAQVIHGQQSLAVRCLLLLSLRAFVLAISEEDREKNSQKEVRPRKKCGISPMANTNSCMQHERYMATLGVLQWSKLTPMLRKFNFRSQDGLPLVHNVTRL